MIRAATIRASTPRPSQIITLWGGRFLSCMSDINVSSSADPLRARHGYLLGSHNEPFGSRAHIIERIAGYKGQGRLTGRVQHAVIIRLYYFDGADSINVGCRGGRQLNGVIHVE